MEFPCMDILEGEEQLDWGIKPYQYVSLSLLVIQLPYLILIPVLTCNLALTYDCELQFASKLGFTKPFWGM